MEHSSKKVHLKPGDPDDRSRILDIEASINATPAIAKAAAQREAVLEAGGAVEFWMKNARRTDGGTGLKQAELARLLGVSQARISQLINAERGQGPSYALLRRICVACGFSWPQGLVEALNIEAPTESRSGVYEVRRQRDGEGSMTAVWVGPRPPVYETIYPPQGGYRIPSSKIVKHTTQLRAAILAQLNPALKNVLLHEVGGTSTSEDFAIIRVDKHGQFDFEHMTLIETKGEDT